MQHNKQVNPPAPYGPEEIAFIHKLVQQSTPMQRSWLSGYLAGIDAAKGVPVAQGAEPAAAVLTRVPMTILYGSESGNAEALAFKAKKLASKLGIDAKVADMADADLAALAKSRNLAVYVSTWGEGEPPQRAGAFYKALMADDAPRFDGVRYTVLALGDSAYVNFCETGRQIDARIEALGGTRIGDRIELDLDYAKAAQAWTDEMLARFQPAESASATVVHIDFKSGGPEDAEAAEPVYTADNPCEAKIAALVNLNGTGSTRETWHVELALEAGDFHYEPGAAIGVLPVNDHALAADLAQTLGLDSDAGLVAKLARSCDITTLSRTTVTAYAKLTGRSDVAALLEGDALARFAADRQLIDFFETYRETLTADQLLKLLRPLPGRLYSVASSLKAHPGEAHLLVGSVKWASHGRQRRGVASSFLGERKRIGDAVRLYTKPNRHFRLPRDGAAPIIMIGSGTGVAPYRGFIEDRVETGAAGKSWLFFGERNFTHDFLYQLEWQEHLASGALSRIDVAFSRDQPEKVYVQHCLWARRDELRGWLADGAHLYVCGDEKGMARDVDHMLARILAGDGAPAEGQARLAELTKAGRYQRDVY